MNKLYNRKELAGILGLSILTVTNRLLNGEIKYTNVGTTNRKIYRVR